ncbi:MAG: PilZ domain-containing protein [Candidatus Omnitrophota bacterium]|nr:PilZ domain-containing protein [Candidatus Omnitrophota bacterium]
MEEERRVVPRISFDSPVRYRQEGLQRYSDTTGKDISTSGIRFISNEFIPKNSKLIFELRPPWRAEPIQATAKVVWISNQPYSEKFEVGARFLSPLTGIT